MKNCNPRQVKYFFNFFETRDVSQQIVVKNWSFQTSHKKISFKVWNYKNSKVIVFIPSENFVKQKNELNFLRQTFIFIDEFGWSHLLSKFHLSQIRFETITRTETGRKQLQQIFFLKKFFSSSKNRKPIRLSPVIAKFWYVFRYSKEFNISFFLSLFPSFLLSFFTNIIICCFWKLSKYICSIFLRSRWHYYERNFPPVLKLRKCIT